MCIFLQAYMMTTAGGLDSSKSIVLIFQDFLRILYCISAQKLAFALFFSCNVKETDVYILFYVKRAQPARLLISNLLKWQCNEIFFTIFSWIEPY